MKNGESSLEQMRLLRKFQAISFIFGSGLGIRKVKELTGDYAAMDSTTPSKVKWSSITLSSTTKPIMTADLYTLNNLASSISTSSMPSRRKTGSWRDWSRSMRSFWGIGCLPHQRWQDILWKLAVPFWIYTMLVSRHFTKVLFDISTHWAWRSNIVCSERLCQRS